MEQTQEPVQDRYWVNEFVVLDPIPINGRQTSFVYYHVYKADRDFPRGLSWSSPKPIGTLSEDDNGWWVVSQELMNLSGVIHEYLGQDFETAKKVLVDRVHYMGHLQWTDDGEYILPVQDAATSE